MTLVLDHLPLAAKQARRYGHLRDDLAQEGAIAIMAAADAYIPGPIGFKRFAVKRIRWAMANYQREHSGPVRLPASPGAMALRGEMPERMDHETPESRLRDAQEAASRVATVALAIAGASLTARERAVIDLRFFGEGATQNETADSLGLTRQMVRQAEGSAKGKIRRAMMRGNR
jgi:RNA polymerase sigma factor (sigma-70 family)